MVEIIPYEEDDADSSDWLPLSTKIAHSETRSEPLTNAASFTRCGSISNRNDLSESANYAAEILNRKNVKSEHRESEEDDSEWQRSLSYTNSCNNYKSSSLHLTMPSTSLESHLIAHLTSTLTKAPTNVPCVQDDELSENDENILWRRANEICDEDWFGKSEHSRLNSTKREDYDDFNASKKRQSLARSYAEHEHQTQPSQPVRGSLNHINWKHPTLDSKEKQTEILPAVQLRLQNTLFYDPLRALPLCFLRHLYREVAYELKSAWNKLHQEKDLETFIAALTLILIVVLLAIALIWTGVYGIASLCFSSFLRIGVSCYNAILYMTWWMVIQLAWISFCLLIIIWLLIWMYAVKSRNATDHNSLPGNSISRGTSFHIALPAISSLLPWIVALTSPSVYEIIVILYSIQTYTSLLYQDNPHMLHLQNRSECISTVDFDESTCFDDSPHSVLADASPVAVYSIVLVVTLINFLTISVFANTLEGEKKSAKDSVTDLSCDAKSDHFTVKENIRNIKCHLNACHLLSVVILGLLSIIILLLQNVLLYSLQDVRSFLRFVFSGVRAIGCNLTCIAVGVTFFFLLSKAARLSIDNYIHSTFNQSRHSWFQRIVQTALKKSLTEVTTHAFRITHNDGSSFTSSMPEEDWALRLAVFEWLVENLSYASHSTIVLNSPSGHCSSTTATASNNKGKYDTQSHPGQSTLNKDQFSLPSYQSLQKVISKLDADEVLIPTIERFRAWVYTLPPTRSAAMCVALWRKCPAITALLLRVLWCTVLWIHTILWSLIKTNFISKGHGNSDPSSFFKHQCAIVVILSPLIYLEIHLVRQWRAKVFCNISDIQSNDHEKNVPDTIIIMIGCDSDDLSSSTLDRYFTPKENFILRLWELLLESISLLESSIPAVRCATIACATADLTNDAIHLVDFAVEIKNRGFVGGFGLFIMDAFCHFLSKELHHQTQAAHLEKNMGNSDGESDNTKDFGVQYTGHAVNAVSNIVKLAHNLNCLAEKDIEFNQNIDKNMHSKPNSLRNRLDEKNILNDNGSQSN